MRLANERVVYLGRLVHVCSGQLNSCAVNKPLGLEFRVRSGGWCPVEGDGKGKRRSIAVRNTPHRYGNSDAITQCYLPSGGGDIPALTPAEASTQLSDPGGMQG